MRDEILAFQRWGEYAPKFCLTLETDAEMSEICALDEEGRRFVPIARGRDPVRLIIDACDRLVNATPGHVSHLEIEDLFCDNHEERNEKIELICVHFQRIQGGECVARSHRNAGPCAGPLHMRVVIYDIDDGSTEVHYAMICKSHAKEETAQFNHEGTTYKVRDEGDEGWSVVPMKLEELPD